MAGLFWFLAAFLSSRNCAPLNIGVLTFLGHKGMAAGTASGSMCAW
jgi:hypothetical protein